MNCKPGDLAVIVRAHIPENVGLFVTVLHGEPGGCGWMWECESARAVPSLQFGMRAPAGRRAWSYDSDLLPIRDQPGNEHFVTEARKKLPRTKDTVRIDERGEIA